MNRMRRVVAGALLLGSGSLAASVASAEPTEEWVHWSRFRDVGWEGAPGDDGLVRFAVPDEIFGEARSDLADLRIVDERGRETGYVLFSRGDHSAAEWRATGLSDTGFVPGRYTQVVVDTGEEDELHNALEVTLPDADEEFFAWAEIAASPDLETWRVVRAKAPVYRFRERGFRRGITIRYPQTRDRWLRLRLLRGDDEVPIERVRVAEQIETEADLTRVRRQLSLREDSPEGESWWEPHGEMHRVPIAAVRFATDQEAFHRPVRVEVEGDDGWRRIGEGTIYRYPAGETEADDPGSLRQSLQVDVRNTSAARWRVTILDRDDPPLPDVEVSLMQSRRYVVFRPAADRSYRVLYGNDRAEPPEYEIADIVSRDQQATALLAELGPEQTNEEWVTSAPFTERHPALLWAALLLAVAVLAALALKSLRS